MQNLLRIGYEKILLLTSVIFRGDYLSCLKLNELAELLGISMFLLVKVRWDFANLSEETAVTLVEIFLILFDE